MACMDGVVLWLCEKMRHTATRGWPIAYVIREMRPPFAASNPTRESIEFLEELIRTVQQVSCSWEGPFRPCTV